MRICTRMLPTLPRSQVCNNARARLHAVHPCSSTLDRLDPNKPTEETHSALRETTDAVRLHTLTNVLGARHMMNAGLALQP